MMGIVLSETCWACNKICNKCHLLHLVGESRDVNDTSKPLLFIREMKSDCEITGESAGDKKGVDIFKEEEKTIAEYDL